MNEWMNDIDEYLGIQRKLYQSVHTKSMILIKYKVVDKFLCFLLSNQHYLVVISAAMGFIN